MRYYSKLTKKGIGCIRIPERKNNVLVYIDGNTDTVIGTVRNQELFCKAIEDLIDGQFDDWTNHREQEDE